MRLIKMFTGCLLGLLLAACAKPSSVGESSPSWIDRPYDVVSQKQYVAAVGEADDLNTASDRAMANIAKVFEVKIDEQTSDFTQVNQFSGNQQASKSTQFQGVSRLVGADTQQVLSGVSIKESWKSEVGRHYSLAVLEKSLAESLFLKDIASSEARVANYVSLAGKGNDIVDVMSNLHHAHVSAAGAEATLKQLAIITDAVPQLSVTTNDIQRSMADNANVTRVSVKGDTPWLTQLVSSGASANGLNVLSRSGLVLKGALVLDDVTKKQGWYWQKGVIKLALIESDVILSEKIWPVKISSTEKGLLLPRFQQEVGKNINAYVYQVLTQKQ